MDEKRKRGRKPLSAEEKAVRLESKQFLKAERIQDKLTKKKYKRSGIIK